jgi:inner membrane protein involved in colicin E2 resistance
MANTQAPLMMPTLSTKEYIMKKIGLGIKIGLLLLITVVLQLPISLIKNIVAERQDNQTQVTQQLSKNVGGVSLFIVMSAVMIATRRLNWYALTDVNDAP